MRARDTKNHLMIQRALFAEIADIYYAHIVEENTHGI